MAEETKQAAMKPEDVREVIVRVNDKIAARGGTFHDPEFLINPKTIGKDPIKVKLTSFVDARIGSKDLVEIRR